LRTRFKLTSYAVLMCLVSAPLWANQNTDAASRPPIKTLQFLHEEYPPYVYIKDGVVVGAVAKLAGDIVGRAGYAIEWSSSNYRRLIREILLSDKPLCAAGYSGQHENTYDVLASKQIAWFPGTALAIRNSDVHLFEKHKSIAKIMGDTSLRGAFLMGAQYTGVDEDVRSGRVDRHILISSSDTELGLLVARGRVHFAVINPDQTNYLATEVPSAANLMVFRATGMAPPRKVGFICSKATGAEIMERLNEAIEPLPAYEAWERGIKKATQK